MTIIAAILISFSMGFGMGADKCTTSTEQCKQKTEQAHIDWE